MNRRTFISALGALGAASAFAQTERVPAERYRVDVHHHILPPDYMKLTAQQRGGPAPDWSPERSLDEMDRAGIQRAVLSLVQPGVWFGDDGEGRRLARGTNDYGARLVRDHAGRFGLFAAIPYPDTEGSLREIEYALDILKADGIGLMTSYGNRWLGDRAFWPVLEELNRRKAVVYTHPTQPNCCRGLIPEVPTSAIEYATDTTRTIASLILSGTSQKYKDINWIWSHGGGALTAFAERFLIQVVNTPPYKDKFTRATMQAELNRFFYDTAQVSNEVTIEALAKLVPVSQIVYGTDFPYRTAVDHTKGVTAHFKGEDLRKIDRENALRILPGLRSA
jgi:predicted TIM-barrel fold metal-dependent hydrolase